MIDILQEIVSTYLIPAVITALGGFITWIGTKIKKIYEEKVKSEEVKHIVYNVVKYVERTMTSAKGEEKFNEALKQVSEWLGSKGIQISDVEMKLLIESAVNDLPKTNKEE
jgi:intergrase/recombinase